MAAAGLALACLLAPRVASGAGTLPAGGGVTGSSYEVVDLNGQAYAASALLVTREGLKVVTPAGLRELPSASIDWYETFRRNVASGATNVVVFKTGALLRFDRFDIENGLAKLTTAGGGQLAVAESLIDFEQSVREGALVKLPEGAGSAVAVSSGGSGGGWSGGDEDSGGDEAAPGSPRARRAGGSLASRRRAALGGQPPTSPDETAMPEALPEPMEEPPPMDTQPPAPEDLTAGENGPGNPRSSFRNRGPSGRNSGGIGGQQDGQESGQAVVTVTTDYAGAIGGLQLTLSYPPNLQLVEPVAFTGFAGNWLATPNTTVAGQIVIAGAAPPGTSIGGGEFLRVTFVWSGQPPARQLFRLASIQVSGPDSNPITDFRTTLDVQTTP